MDYDKAESQAADAVITYAFTLVKQYTDHPGDVDAAMTALLSVALEKLLNKEVCLRGYYTWAILSWPDKKGNN